MDFNHLMAKVRTVAAVGVGTVSTGEALAAALVLNRPDLLESMGYSITEALDRIDDDTAPLLSRAAKKWAAEIHTQKIQQQERPLRETARATFEDQPPDPLMLAAQLVTYSEAPGYREVSFTFDVRVLGLDVPYEARRVELRIRPEDGEAIAAHLQSVHSFAWSSPRARPLDAKPGETRPAWINR